MKHIIENCKILNKENDNNTIYENLFNENVIDQKQICQKFKENMKYLKEIIK